MLNRQGTEPDTAGRVPGPRDRTDARVDREVDIVEHWRVIPPPSAMATTLVDTEGACRRCELIVSTTNNADFSFGRSRKQAQPSPPM